MAASTEPRFLLVEDEPLVAYSLLRMLKLRLKGHGKFVVAGTVREALAILKDDHDWTAFIIDIGLPDGCGLDVLAYARLNCPTTPALILSGRLDEELVNRTYELRGLYTCKPASAARLAQFLDDAASSSMRLERALAAWTARYGLLPSHVDVLRRAALGKTRKAIAAARGTSEETIKKQVHVLLGRTADPSLLDAIARLLRESEHLFSPNTP